MKFTVAAALFAGLAAAQVPQCYKVVVLGAREISADELRYAFGHTADLMGALLELYKPNASSKAIKYPASTGGVDYGGTQLEDSIKAGIKLVIKEVNAYHQYCPLSQIVLLGYAQGAEIMDRAICGNDGDHFSDGAERAIKAAMFMFYDKKCRKGPACPVNDDVARSYLCSPKDNCCNGTVNFAFAEYYTDEAFNFVKQAIPVEKY